MPYNYVNKCLIKKKLQSVEYISKKSQFVSSTIRRPYQVYIRNLFNILSFILVIKPLLTDFWAIVYSEFIEEYGISRDEKKWRRKQRKIKSKSRSLVNITLENVVEGREQLPRISPFLTAICS